VAGVEHPAVLVARDGRFVAGLRHLALEERVNQRGFADVRHAHHHHAHAFVRPVWHEGRREARDLRDLVGALAGDRHRGDALLLAEVLHPGGARRGVGEVGLVEDLQARPLPLIPHALDHRVAARAGEAGVEDFDDDVDLRHRLGRLLARVGHVAGKPFDGHAGSSFRSCSRAGP
jgi:hypothetical protein